METARCLLADPKIHNRFWPEVVQTAAYLKNRTLANTLEKKTPYEIIMGEKSNIKNLKLYGSRVFVRVSEIKRKSKWDRKADLGVLVGYDSVGYKVLTNNRVIVAKHVDIIEKNVKLVGFGDNDAINENNDEIILPPTSTLGENRGRENDLENQNKNEENENNEINENENIENNEYENNVPSSSKDNLIVPRRSSRKKSLPNRYGNPVTNCIYVNYVSIDNPESYNEAINSNESEK